MQRCRCEGSCKVGLNARRFCVLDPKPARKKDRETAMLVHHKFHNKLVFLLYFTITILIAINNCRPIGRSEEINMVDSYSQSASVGSESEIETGPATQSITILGLQFNVRSPYSAGHVCTKEEARALNRKRLESIRNHLAVMAKNGVLTQADVDAYAASYVFGGRSTRHQPVEAEALALARRFVWKRGQSRTENTEAARELLQSEMGEAIRAQAAKRVADLKV